MSPAARGDAVDADDRPYVARTCVELQIEARQPAAAGAPQPLGAFRDVPAYVLLGNAGAGKTEEFRRECRELGDAAEFVTARNFAGFEPDAGWRDKTLFIDGLDEMRAGAADARVPLDQIRRRLRRLGHPRFRISCREADWLGSNDRQHLEEVAPDGRIKMLRLDPLTDSAALELLSARLGVSRAREAVALAYRHELQGMLANPLTLELLVAAFAGNGSDEPQSRRAVFELACGAMAKEHSREHVIGGKTRHVEELLAAAGELCVRLLLVGMEGFSLEAEGEASSFVSLDRIGVIDGGSAVGDLELWKSALTTKLFVAVSESSNSEPVRLVPRHRQIAEFVGGRYLARLVDRGLPVQRAVALMSSPADGVIVTSLRGLSAWFAAHSSQALDVLLGADPVGVGLYGDINDRSADQKRRILRAVAGAASRGPLVGREWRYDGVSGVQDSTAWAFRSLAAIENQEAIADLLADRGDEVASDRRAWFLLEVLVAAEDDRICELEDLAPVCMGIVRDATRTPHTRRAALEAYLRLVPATADRVGRLVRLLHDIRDGAVTDPEDDLKGTLLGELYPTAVGPGDIWQYLALRNFNFHYGRFERFWDHDLAERSSPEDLRALLDDLHENAADRVPVVQPAYLGDNLLALLAEALDILGDETEIEHLVGWLTVIGACARETIAEADPAAREAALREIVRENLEGEESTALIDAEADPPKPILRARAWLEDRPDVQNAAFLHWMRTRDESGPFGLDAYWQCDALLGSRLPDDFGLWCAEEACELAETEPEIARDLIRRAHSTLTDPSTSGLSETRLRDMTRGHEALETLVSALCDPSPPDPQTRQREQRRQEAREQRESKQRAEAQDWADHLRENLDSLRDDTFLSGNFATLGRIFFGHDSERGQTSTGTERIAAHIGGDPELVDAVLHAFRRTIHRLDLPDVDQTLDVHARSTSTRLVYPILAFPLLAGLELRDADAPGNLDALRDDLKRRALALLYCVSSVTKHPRWYQRWFDQDPGLAAEIAYRFAARTLRDGKDRLQGLADLDAVVGHDDTKQDIKLQLLRAFPARAPQTQIRLLDRLLLDLFAASRLGRLNEVAITKLSSSSMSVAQRVRWLAAAALSGGGEHAHDLRSFCRGRPNRIQMLAEFLHADMGPRIHGIYGLTSDLDATTLGALIELLGAVFPENDDGGIITVEKSTSRCISHMISQLAGLPGQQARLALRQLTADPALAAWHGALREATEQQNVVERDASFRPPRMNEVERTLSNGEPASAADLAALALSRLGELRDQLRGSAANLWRHFWNEDPAGNPANPKNENSCRDFLLQMLRERLPRSATALPEAMHASSKRADVGIRYGQIAVPIEIKPSMSRTLWTGLRDQLIEQYTTDPDADGHGIYVVLWFGSDLAKQPSDEAQPTTPDELERRLEAELSAEESRKISVMVLDVTKPGKARHSQAL